MSYKYIIIQEENNNKTKLTYEFTASDEDDLVEELNTFIRSIGYTESGYLTLVNDEEFEDDLESEVEDSINFGRSEMNPDIETYKNFEFPLSSYEEGQGQMDYNYTPDYEQTNQYEMYGKNEVTATFPFPLDRPSQSTYRVDSIYNTDTSNVQHEYYGA